METQACKKVFLVEDFAPVRHRLTELLGEIDGVEVVGEAVKLLERPALKQLVVQSG